MSSGDVRRCRIAIAALRASKARTVSDVLSVDNSMQLELKSDKSRARPEKPREPERPKLASEKLEGAANTHRPYSVWVPKVHRDAAFWSFMYAVSDGEINRNWMETSAAREKETQIRFRSAERMSDVDVCAALKKHGIKGKDMSGRLGGNASFAPPDIVALASASQASLVWIRGQTYIKTLHTPNSKTVVLIGDTACIKDDPWSTDDIDELVRKCVRIDNLSKPLKGIGSYTLAELCDLHNRLGLPQLEGRATKGRLYEAIKMTLL